MEFIQEYLLQLIITVITGVASYIGLQIKSAYVKHIDTKTKETIVKDTVRYVEQVYKNLKGDEKLAEAKIKALEWLTEKGLKISETELEILIESAVNGLQGGK